MDRYLPIPLPLMFLMIRKTDRVDKVIGSDKKYIEPFTRKEGTAHAIMFPVSCFMWTIDSFVKGVVPNQKEPMSLGAMFTNNDHFTTVMSAFGSHIPSPEISGTSK
jgi:hypothetical protein